MAQAAGVRREMWARYEAGAEPGAQALAGAALAGIDLHFVLTGSAAADRPPPLTAEELLVLERYREASRETRAAALGALGGGQVHRGRHLTQVFHAGVGQIIEAVRDVTIHQTAGTYKVAKKSPKGGKKPPE